MAVGGGVRLVSRTWWRWRRVSFVEASWVDEDSVEDHRVPFRL